MIPERKVELRRIAKTGAWMADRRYLDECLDEIERLQKQDWAKECDALSGQIIQLAKVLLDEFGGPTRDEGAVEMAIRLLRESKSARREQMERDCRAVCVYCRKGREPFIAQRPPLTGMWAHSEGSCGEPCGAHHIRKAFEEKK